MSIGKYGARVQMTEDGAYSTSIFFVRFFGLLLVLGVVEVTCCVDFGCICLGVGGRFRVVVYLWTIAVSLRGISIFCFGF